MSLRNHADRRNPFADDVSPEELDAESYQDTRPANPELNTGRVVAKPLAITDIWADVKQPRRAVPGLIRLNWDGNPAMVTDLLQRWQQVAEQKAGTHFPLIDMLNGQGEGFAEEDAHHPYAADFIKLVRLAQSIHTDGLINPITVIKQGAKHVIEGGERRWLAHHLLVQHIDDKYEKIPAIEGSAEDAIWRQAHENNNRDSLNAIAKARQLALLIMALRRDMNDYQTYEELVVGCDRIYYAQVANGRIHSIPQGMGERVESAMGLTIARVNQYRSLLRLTEDNEVNDILWMRASDESWAEYFMRDVAKLPMEALRRIVLGSQDWTQDDLRDAIESTAVDSSSINLSDDSGTKPTPLPRESLIKGTIIQRGMGDYWRIEDVYAGGNTFYCASPTGYNMAIPYDKITAIANDKADLFKPRQPAPDNRTGLYARTEGGLVFKIEEEVDGWLHFTKDGRKQSVHSKHLVWCGEQKPKELNESEPDKRPSLDAWYGIRVQSPGGLIGKVNGVSGMMLNCRTDDGKISFSVLPADAKLVDKDYQPEGRVSVDVNTGKVSGDTPPESDDDSTPDNPQQTSIPKDKFGVPLLEGATVRTRVGHTGRVTGYNGRRVTVNVNGLRTDHAADTLEVIPSDTFIPTPEEKAHIESFLDGDRVRLCRQIGGTAEGAEGTVKVWDDGERAVVFDGTGYYTSRVKVDDQRSHILLWCDLLESDEDDELPTYNVGNKVYLNQNEAMQGTIRYVKTDKPKPYGVFLHHSQSTHYYGADELSPLVEAVESVDSAVNDGEILDKATVELLEGLMQAARACDIQQWIILDDLTKLNHKQLRENIARIGIEAVERMTTNYQVMTKEMLMEIEKQFNDHMQRVLMAALEIAKEKQ